MADPSVASLVERLKSKAVVLEQMRHLSFTSEVAALLREAASGLSSPEPESVASLVEREPDEHAWVVFDGSAHCYGCGTTLHRENELPERGCLPITQRLRRYAEKPEGTSRRSIVAMIGEVCGYTERLREAASRLSEGTRGDKAESSPSSAPAATPAELYTHYLSTRELKDTRFVQSICDAAEHDFTKWTRQRADVLMIRGLAKLPEASPRVSAATPAPPDDLGLSIDMTYADQLREWADRIAEQNPNTACWSSPPAVAERMRRIAVGIEQAVRDIGVLRAVSPAERPAPTWQPIESAPKERTLGEPQVDLWMEVYASPASFGMSDSFRVPDCWRDYTTGKWVHRDRGEVRELNERYITHWMPLPAPPGQVAQTQEKD